MIISHFGSASGTKFPRLAIGALLLDSSKGLPSPTFLARLPPRETLRCKSWMRLWIRLCDIP